MPNRVDFANHATSIYNIKRCSCGCRSILFCNSHGMIALLESGVGMADDDSAEEMHGWVLDALWDVRKDLVK